MLSLIDAARDGDYLLPRAIVIEPDYLIDVSSIAECFKDSGVEPYSYLVKKFLPYALTPPILLGNIANHFLDRLLHEPEADFPTLFKETFGLYPLAYAGLNDAQVRDIQQKAQGHYLRLRHMAREGFALQGIDPEHSSLEPSFYSSQYGLQGRLDLFCRNQRGAHIVELKSGEPFRPNSYGIQRSHFTQTLLYDLLIRSVYGAEAAKYILYSGAHNSPLRFAPTVAPEQWEALQARNRILAIERLLMQIKPGTSDAPVIRRLCELSDKYSVGFLARDFTDFAKTYAQLDSVERKYLLAFVGFIAREHWIAKAGVENDEQTSGQAALWRRNLPDKERSFNILNELEIVENHADRPDARIAFKKTAATNPLANFRVGDIVALYPATDPEQSVLDHQVIKGYIAHIDADRVDIQLRYRQSNLRHFETGGATWRAEPDTMDAGFTSMYRGLFAWAAAQAGKRALLLQRPPAPAPGASP
ncbi:MAG: DNA helicase, partial [Saprospiraceae bacterium]